MASSMLSTMVLSACAPLMVQLRVESAAVRPMWLTTGHLSPPRRVHMPPCQHAHHKACVHP